MKKLNVIEVAYNEGYEAFIKYSSFAVCHYDSENEFDLFESWQEGYDQAYFDIEEQIRNNINL